MPVVECPAVEVAAAGPPDSVGATDVEPDRDDRETGVSVIVQPWGFWYVGVILSFAELGSWALRCAQATGTCMTRTSQTTRTGGG